MPTSPDRRAEPGDPLPAFDELINTLIGLPADGEPLRVGGKPLGDLLDAQGHALVHEAAKRVHEDGSARLDTGHLLWAATKVDPSRDLFQQVSVDPDLVAAHVGAALSAPRPGHGTGPADGGLSPEASRAFECAGKRAEATGSAAIGPEHILDALLTEPDPAVAALLEGDSVDLGRLRMYAERDELRLSDDAEAIAADLADER